MEWMVVGLIVLGVVALVVLWVVRREVPDDAEPVDPLLVVGIPVAGAGAALITTLGPASYVMLGVGVVLLVAGAWRSRHRPG